MYFARFRIILLVLPVALVAARINTDQRDRGRAAAAPPMTVTILQDGIAASGEESPDEHVGRTAEGAQGPAEAEPDESRRLSGGATDDAPSEAVEEPGGQESGDSESPDDFDLDLDSTLHSPMQTRLDRIEELLSDKRYEGLQTGRYFPRQHLRTIKDVVFLEGPACDADGNVYFTNIPFERIMCWNANTHRLRVFREASNAANGLAFDSQGRMLICEGGKGRLTRLEIATDRLEVLADNYLGRPLGRPNDVCLDNKQRIYFSARFGSHPAPGQYNAVYRIDPDGSIDRIVASPDVDMPNGLATSPDDSILYVVDSNGNLGRARCIRAFPLLSDGTVGKGSVLYNFYPGRSGDGMAVDVEGNLYVAAGLHHVRGSSETLDTQPGIHVISPEGKLLAYIETPEDTVTNCTFGGPDLRTLYITCGKKLMAVRTAIAGKPIYRPKQ